MKALKVLTLSNNQLSTVPAMNQLTELKELVLSANAFNEFPAAICAIPHLATLSLASNGISSVPNECALCEISTLFVFKLTQIPSYVSMSFFASCFFFFTFFQ